MTFRLYQEIELQTTLPALGLSVGARGVIVDEYHAPYHAYEIEFVNEDGETIGCASVRPEQIAEAHVMPLRLAA